jgi:hypothetical protein
VPTRQFNHHGQSEKETSSEDEQAQAPEALESESPQKAHVAEVSAFALAARHVSAPNPSHSRRVFYCRIGTCEAA